MNLPASKTVPLLTTLIFTVAQGWFNAAAQTPGPPGSYAIYKQTSSNNPAATLVKQLTVRWGNRIESNDPIGQWLQLDAEKFNQERFHVWFLVQAYPSKDVWKAESDILRYLLAEGDSPPLEYTHRFTGAPVLPALGFWEHQLPRAVDASHEMKVFPSEIQFLGHRMKRLESGQSNTFTVPDPTRLELPCDLEIGTKYSNRDRREPRRFDGAPVELISFEPEDYPERFAAGQTIFNVPANHLHLVERRPVFYMCGDIAAMRFPECLYRSNFVGLNADYLDEPAARTSFAALRPQLDIKPDLQRSITPQSVLSTFTNVFHEAVYQGRPTWLDQRLRTRSDVDLGSMQTLQSNMWSWEVPISTGAWQLRAEPKGPPAAIVYESRLSTGRDMPRFISQTGAQIPTDDQRALLNIIFGMLRGTARVTHKKWGMSVYGQHAVGEIHQTLTQAYDLGASYFLFWTSDHGHHIPYEEQLQYSRFIHDYAEAHPGRDMEQLKNAAETLILFPPGYTLLIGRPMWWLPELHLERNNQHGLTYRAIYQRIGAEIERCYRQGITYDLAWDLDGLDLSGYREVIHIAETGIIRVEKSGVFSETKAPRTPLRPQGEPPLLEVELSTETGHTPLTITATGHIKQNLAPVYYTHKHDDQGTWHNTQIIWQLYGPEEWDFQYLDPVTDSDVPRTTFTLDKHGTYKLRACAVDRTGRSTVVWKNILAE